MHRAGRGQPNTAVEITGSREATSRAKVLIEELVEPIDGLREQYGGMCSLAVYVLRGYLHSKAFGWVMV